MLAVTEPDNLIQYSLVLPLEYVSAEKYTGGL